MKIHKIQVQLVQVQLVGSSFPSRGSKVVLPMLSGVRVGQKLLVLDKGGREWYELKMSSSSHGVVVRNYFEGDQS